MVKRYLITGGTGFLGRSLVRALLARGDAVRVLDTDTRGKIGMLEDVRQDFEFIRADVRDGTAVECACAGIDVVCHLAFIAGTGSFYSAPDSVLEVGVKGMTNVLDGCLKHGVPELLLTSSAEVYHDPPRVPSDESVPLTIPDVFNARYSYAGSKIISELLAINYGRRHFRKVAIVRPHNIFGPGMNREHVIPQLIERLETARRATGSVTPVPLKIQGSGNETRSYLYVDDYTRAALSVLDHGEHLGLYHIGSMEERSTRQLALEIASCINIDIAIEPGPLQPGSTMRRCPDTSRLAQLRFAPEVTFRDGLRRTVEWHIAALIDDRA